MKKNIIKFGNSVGITFDKVILEITGFKEKDELEATCSKGKLVVTAKKQAK